MKKIGVLFVCMGNICRSPTAEGVFRHLLEQENLGPFFKVDSAGTHGYHAGAPPDRRATQAAHRRNIDLTLLKARRFGERDFAEFDFVLAMDKENYRFLEEMCPSQYQERLKLFLSLAPELKEDEVPDPYYGSMNGFEHVLDLIETGSQALLKAIRAHYKF